jgi:hypothetical protein
MMHNNYYENYCDVEIQIHRYDENSDWRWYINQFSTNGFGIETKRTIQKSLNGFEDFAMALNNARIFMAKHFAPHHEKQDWRLRND